MSGNQKWLVLYKEMWNPDFGNSKNLLFPGCGISREKFEFLFVFSDRLDQPSSLIASGRMYESVKQMG